MTHPVLVAFLNILKCVISFYVVFYMVICLAFGAFKLDKFDACLPFDHINFLDFSKCCSSYKDYQLASLISMQLAFFLSTFIIAFFIQTRVWNYALLITFTHFCMCSIVMVAFPMNWSWWVCLFSGMLLMTSLGEMTCYCRRNQGQAKVFAFNKPKHEPEPDDTSS